MENFTHLQVTARADSFWRCGIQFTGEPRMVKRDELTADQIARLENEKMLVTQRVVQEEKTSSASAGEDHKAGQFDGAALKKVLEPFFDANPDNAPNMPDLKKALKDAGFDFNVKADDRDKVWAELEEAATS